MSKAKARKKRRTPTNTNHSGVLADGAEELLIAMETPAPNGQVGIPVIVTSGPGTGKSSMIESLGSPDFPVVTLVASICDPTDFAGLPIQDGNVVRYLPPDFVELFEGPKKGILFLDELTTAPAAVQAALLRVVLERKVGNYTLPPGVRIVAAANPADSIFGGVDLTPPLANRFVHIDWSFGGTAFADAMKHGFAKPERPRIDRAAHARAVEHWGRLAAACLSRDPSLIDTKPAEGEYAFASPRTWSFAIHLCASLDVLGKAPKGNPIRVKKVFTRLLQGAIGTAAATTFMGFLRDMKLPNPDRVLNGQERVEIDSLNDDEMYVFFSTLAASLEDRSEKAESPFFDGMVVFLELVEQAERVERLDTVFVPVHAIARSEKQLLQKAATIAHQQGCLPEFQSIVQSAFEGGMLAEYLELIPGVVDEIPSF